MTLHVAVDFGTSSTCVAVSTDATTGSQPQVVVVDGQPLVPSAVYAAPDGTLFVGHEAQRQAAVDPSRYEPHPKRRIDEGELLLGGTVLPVDDVVRAVLTRAVGEARRLADGAPVDLLVLTHPADWGAIRTRVLRDAARGLANEVVLVPEPVAAAVFHSVGQVLADGSALAVLDLGGGTVDASVVRRQGSSFAVLATRGDPNFGGADIDQALLEHVSSVVAGIDPDTWQKLVEGRELADRRRRRVLRQDVRGAKETLSRHAYTDLPLPPPFPDAHVTRADLEKLIHAPLARAAGLVATTVREAGLAPRQLAGVFLVGGSSRIPLVARLVHERTGIVPTTLDQPETVVARGALRAVTLDPYRTGGLAHPGAETVRTPQRVPTPAGGVPAMPAAATPTPHTPPYGTHQPATATPPSTPHFGMGAATPVSVPGVAHGTPRKQSRLPWLVVGAVVAVAAVIGVLVVLNSGGDKKQAEPNPGGNTGSAPRELAQYDYRFGYPSDWEQTGGEPASRRVQIRPRDARTGENLIAVEERVLTFDSTADRGKAIADLRAKYDDAIAHGQRYSGFDQTTGFAGKDVISYRLDLGSATVDWYVLFQGKAQVSVGCQFTPDGVDRVRQACEQVVGSLRVTSNN